MQTEHLILEKHLKRANFISNAVSVVVALFTALSVGFGFYYNTKSTLNVHTSDIKEIKVEVEQVKTKVNESAVYQGVSSAEIKSLQEKVNSIDAKVDKVDEKLDKLILRK